jgi:hypothetical protein
MKKATLATGIRFLLTATLSSCLLVACSASNGEPVGGGAGSGGSSGSGSGAGSTSSTGGAAGSGGGSFGDGGFVTTDSGTGTGSGDGSLSEGCATASHTGELVQLDIYLVLDQSGSMSETDGGGGESRWTQVTGAIAEFLTLPGTEGIGMGIGFFPLEPSISPPIQCSGPGDCYPYSDVCMFNQCLDNIGEDSSCIPGDYRIPAVSIELLPGASGAINGAIGAHGPSGTTPMAPALWGAMEYASEWAGAHPDHATIVVLATDGLPTNCIENKSDNVAAIAAGGLDSAGIQTFVIGIGDGLDDLNKIAAAGGTDAALMVESGNASVEFLQALDQIRGSVACTYKIPLPDVGDPDYNKVNVAHTPEGGQEEVFPRVDGEAACQGAAKGWYYDNPSDPKQIVLCPASCDAVQQNNGRVDVVLGCQSVVK